MLLLHFKLCHCISIVEQRGYSLSSRITTLAKGAVALFIFKRRGLCWNKMCLTLALESFDDNKVLKIVNWIC